jgi:hypothetical protein
MVLQQASEARSPSVKKFRDSLMTIINDKHQPVIAKSGAILATGIIDAGGGNVVVSMQSRAGFIKMGGAVGVMMFLQHWYWSPLLPFLSLAFSPTMLIGINKDFDMPVAFEAVCNAPPSMFAYNSVEEKKEDDKKQVTTAVLSTTVRAKAREARKEAKKLGNSSSGKQAALSSPLDLLNEVPLERVSSHLSTTSYLSVEAVRMVYCMYVSEQSMIAYCPHVASRHRTTSPPPTASPRRQKRRHPSQSATPPGLYPASCASSPYSRKDRDTSLSADRPLPPVS